MGAGNFVPIGIRSSDRPASSESLYRLSYPRLDNKKVLCKNIVVIYGPFVHLFTLSVRLFGQAIVSCLCFIGIKDLFKECCHVLLASCAASPLVSTLRVNVNQGWLVQIMRNLLT